MHKFLTILIFCLAIPSFGRAAEPPIDLSGRKISSIEFVSDVEVQESEIEYLLTFAVGDYYDPEAINQSLKFIYLRNLFENIYAVAEPDGPTEVKIRLVIVPKSLVTRIEFIGNNALSNEKLLNYIKVRLDDELRRDRVAEYIAGIADAYYRSGYTLTKVKCAVVEDPLNHHAELRFYIEEGQVTRISGIEFTGQPVLPDLTLLWEMSSTIGSTLDLNRLDDDIEALQAEYRKRGYFNVKIEKPEIAYTKGVELAKVTIEIIAGDRYEFLVDCGERECFIREREIGALMKLDELDEVNEIRLREIADKIHEFYLRYGYRHAKVETQISELEDGGKLVKISVDEGNLVYVRSIKFDGNLNLDSELLFERMLTRPRSWGSTYGFGYPHVAGVLIDSDMEEDLQQIEKLYQKHGFLSAKAGPIEVIESEDTDEIDLIVPISEGRQTLVRNIIVEGNLVFSRETLLQMLGVKEGQPVDPWALDDGKRSIKTAYLKRGYYHVEVEVGRPKRDTAQSLPAYSGDEVIFSDVKIEINEGIQVRVGKIVVRGNVRTFKFIVLRQMTIKEGDLFDQEKITENRKRLYQLGFFSRVSISSVKGNPEGTRRDLIIEVREADRFKVDFSLGYGSAEGARGSMRLGVDNIAGQGVNVFAQGDLNTGPEIAEQVRYTFMQRNINLGMRVKNIILGVPGIERELDHVDFRLDYFNTIDRSEAVYDLVSDSGVIGFDREFTSTIRGALQYTLEQNNYFNLSGEPEGAIDTIIGVISPIVIADYRNDIFNPTSGWYNAFQYDLAGRFVASNQNFMKLTNRLSAYQEIADGLVLAGSLGAGYGFVYGYSEEIPLSQRYFLGGMKSVRGYALKKLGPRYDDGSPRGGNLMLNYQFEVRFPIYSLLGGVIFSDGGNVWESLDAFAGSGVRYSAGAGLRITTPIGPISLDYGIKLNPVEGDSPAEWHFTVGNAF